MQTALRDILKLTAVLAYRPWPIATRAYRSGSASMCKGTSTHAGQKSKNLAGMPCQRGFWIDPLIKHLRRLRLRVDVDKHQRLAAAAQARLQAQALLSSHAFRARRAAVAALA